MKARPSLYKEDPKRVYDRIQAEWRFSISSKSTKTAPVELPAAKETVRDRVDRMFVIEEEADKSSTCSSKIMPPTASSMNSKGVFSESHVQTLFRLCKDMTVSEPISKPTIVARLEKDTDGKVLLAEVNLQQIVNRLEYEHKQRRVKCQLNSGHIFKQ